jgi:hypothetical protein
MVNRGDARVLVIGGEGAGLKHTFRIKSPHRPAFMTIARRSLTGADELIVFPPIFAAAMARGYGEF